MQMVILVDATVDAIRIAVTARQACQKDNQNQPHSWHHALREVDAMANGRRSVKSIQKKRTRIKSSQPDTLNIDAEDDWHHEASFAIGDFDQLQGISAGLAMRYSPALCISLVRGRRPSREGRAARGVGRLAQPGCKSPRPGPPRPVHLCGNCHSICCTRA
jgi:hypothetical protein